MFAPACVAVTVWLDRRTLLARCNCVLLGGDSADVPLRDMGIPCSQMIEFYGLLSAEVAPVVVPVTWMDMSAVELQVCLAHCERSPGRLTPLCSSGTLT